MGKKKNFRFFSAWGARWTVEQDMTDVKQAYLKAPMKKRHGVLEGRTFD